MNDEQKKSTSTDLTVIDTEASAVPTPSERILAPLTLADYSQFLHETNFGGKKGQDFTFEGIKTLGLNNGISTGEVRIKSPAKISRENAIAELIPETRHRFSEGTPQLPAKCRRHLNRSHPTSAPLEENWYTAEQRLDDRQSVKANLL